MGNLSANSVVDADIPLLVVIFNLKEAFVALIMVQILRIHIRPLNHLAKIHLSPILMHLLFNMI